MGHDARRLVGRGEDNRAVFLRGGLHRPDPARPECDILACSAAFLHGQRSAARHGADFHAGADKAAYVEGEPGAGNPLTPPYNRHEIPIQPEENPGLFCEARHLTAKAKRTARQAGLIGASLLTIGAGAYTVEFKGLPGCNANAMNPTDYVLTKTFDTYCVAHERTGEEVIRRIDGRLERIERNVDMLIARLIPPSSRRTDASEFSFEANSTVFCNPF